MQHLLLVSAIKQALIPLADQRSVHRSVCTLINKLLHYKNKSYTTSLRKYSARTSFILIKFGQILKIELKQRVSTKLIIKGHRNNISCLTLLHKY